MTASSKTYLYLLFENHRTSVVVGPDGVECLKKGKGPLEDIKLFHIKNKYHLKLPCNEYFLIFIRSNEFLYFPFTEYGEGDEFFNNLSAFKDPVLLNIESFSHEDSTLALQLSNNYDLLIKSLPNTDNRSSFNHIILLKNGEVVINSNWPLANRIINNSTTDLNLNLIDQVDKNDQKLINFKAGKIQNEHKSLANRFYLLIIIILLLVILYIAF